MIRVCLKGSWAWFVSSPGGSESLSDPRSSKTVPGSGLGGLTLRAPLIGIEDTELDEGEASDDEASKGWKSSSLKRG